MSKTRIDLTTDYESTTPTDAIIFFDETMLGNVSSAPIIITVQEEKILTMEFISQLIITMIDYGIELDCIEFRFPTRTLDDVAPLFEESTCTMGVRSIGKTNGIVVNL